MKNKSKNNCFPAMGQTGTGDRGQGTKKCVEFKSKSGGAGGVRGDVERLNLRLCFINLFIHLCLLTLLLLLLLLLSTLLLLLLFLLCPFAVTLLWSGARFLVNYSNRCECCRQNGCGLYNANGSTKMAGEAGKGQRLNGLQYVALAVQR